MAQTIKIKRSTSAAAPSGALGAGELAYSFNSNKLFIGDGSNNDIIGGQLYTDMLDHTAGTLTASSAIVVDSSSKIDNLLVDNLQLNGNTVSSASGNLVLTSATGSISLAGAATEILIVDGSSTAFTITEGTSNYITLDTTNGSELITLNKQLELGLDGAVGYTLPTADGTSGQALITDGSGAVTFWFGIVEPKVEDMKQLHFPITVSSSVVYGLEKLENEIEGYYFINKSGDVEVKHVTS